MRMIPPLAKWPILSFPMWPIVSVRTLLPAWIGKDARGGLQWPVEQNDGILGATGMVGNHARGLPDLESSSSEIILRAGELMRGGYH